MTKQKSKWSYVLDQPNAKWIDLVIGGVLRKALVSRGADDLYVVLFPAKELVDGSGQGKDNPNVQGHIATFDKDGKLLKVDAVGWGAEAGFYNTGWPSKPDSVYNANAAKEYFPLVVQKTKSGGWLNKFADGGTTPTQQPSQEQVMKELMSIVQQAATELQSNKPGQGVQTLAQIVNDPQGAELLNMLAQQVPEIEQVIEAVSQMAGSYKCGGKAKKKVKKGAKGCIPCKKLMRIGGTLANVMVDCEGNIISKHLAGGWIRKGSTGFNTAVLNTAYTKAATDAPSPGKTKEVHYYQDVDGSWKKQTWTPGTENTPSSGSWSTGQALTDSDQAAFVQWRNANANKIFKTGFTANWDNYSGTFDTDANAIAAIGQEEFDKGNTAPITSRGVIGKSGNSWLGTNSSKPTMEDYKTQYGGYSGVVARERKLYEDELRKLRQTRNDMYGAARNTRKDANTANDKSRKSVFDHYSQQKKDLKINRGNLAAVIIDDWFKTKIPTGTYTSPSATQNSSASTNLEIVGGSAATKSNESLPMNFDIVQSEYQGGWLTKFN